MSNLGFGECLVVTLKKWEKKRTMSNLKIWKNFKTLVRRETLLLAGEY